MYAARKVARFRRICEFTLLQYEPKEGNCSGWDEAEEEKIADVDNRGDDRCCSIFGWIIGGEEWNVKGR